MIIQAQFGNATGALDPEGFFCEPSYGDLDTALIARYGKLAMYGNNGTRLVFETTDNRRGLIIVSKQQNEANRKALAKFSKKLPSYIYKLGFGQYVVIWTDTKPGEPEPLPIQRWNELLSLGRPLTLDEAEELKGIEKEAKSRQPKEEMY